MEATFVSVVTLISIVNRLITSTKPRKSILDQHKTAQKYFSTRSDVPLMPHSLMWPNPVTFGESGRLYRGGTVFLDLHHL